MSCNLIFLQTIILLQNKLYLFEIELPLIARFCYQPQYSVVSDIDSPCLENLACGFVSVIFVGSEQVVEIRLPICIRLFDVEVRQAAFWCRIYGWLSV